MPNSSGSPVSSQPGRGLIIGALQVSKQTDRCQHTGQQQFSAVLGFHVQLAVVMEQFPGTTLGDTQVMVVVASY